MDQSRKKETIKTVWIKLCLILLFLLSGLFPADTFAQEQESLRVAWYPLEGFFQYNENEKLEGYGVDLLNKITQCSGIRFTYVPAKNLEEAQEMLLDRSADVLMPVKGDQLYSAAVVYIENVIMSTGHMLMTQKSREDIFYEDYDRFSQLKVGITQNMSREFSFDQMAMELQIEKNHIFYFDTLQELYESLETGEVDAVVVNSMDTAEDMKLLFRFDSIPEYIAMPADHMYLPLLDVALQQITTEEPDYLADLTNKWFQEKETLPLTREESEYLKSLGTISFAFYDGQGYLSMKDKQGIYEGFYPRVAEQIAETLGIACEQVSVEVSGECSLVVYPDFYFDFESADQQGVVLTLPYFTIRYYKVVKRNTNPDKSNCKVAAVKELRCTQDYLDDGYQEDQMVWCADYAACIQAVESGTADMAFVSSYAAEYYLSMYRYANLRYSLTTYSNQVAVGIKGDDSGMLLEILDKTVDAFTNEKFNRMIADSTSEHPQQDILQEWIISKPFYASAIAGILGAIIVAAVLVTVFANRTKQQNIRLQQATQAKSEFLARMSHDIRTPLNVIIGMNRLAQENENPTDTKDCLEKIDISSEFLLGLINDVLDMERVETGKMELHLTAYSGEDFKNYIETIIRPLCEQKNLSFEYEYESPQKYTLMQDKLKINQIYFNLLSNAVKYTPEGGMVRFHTRVEVLGEKRVALHVTIADNGIGMSEEFQKHMYDAFAQENQVMTSVSQGTGLGLTIVKRMCDLMHMKIEVESQLGKGTTYRLYGEYEVADDAAVSTHSTDRKLVSKDLSNLKGKTILVCEDHMLNQEIIRRLLEKQDMIVDLVEDGKLGLEKFKKSSADTYDAILMDIRMPVMNGLESTRAIRALKRSDALTIPIIAMTANAYDEDVEKSLQAGMNEHLAKPIDPNRLYETLLKYL